MARRGIVGPWIGAPKLFCAPELFFSATRMKIVFVLLVLVLAGCTEKPKHTGLSLGEATDLAVKLANDEAEALYKCRPFSNGPPAQSVAGGWFWKDHEGQGQFDIEATVKFGTNGAQPSVRVSLLDSRADPLRFR